MSYLPKFSSPILTDTSKKFLAYALTVAYLPNFSSPIAFIIWFAKIFPCQIFPDFGWVKYWQMMFVCQIHQSFPHQNFALYGIFHIGEIRCSYTIENKESYMCMILYRYVHGTMTMLMVPPYMFYCTGTCAAKY